MVSSRLERQQEDWNELASVDPLWAIFAAPDKQHGGWDVEEFFKTGESEIEEVLGVARALELPETFDRALDFGCGVGRTTRALSAHFRECVGIDISDRMIRLARELNEDRNNCAFLVNVAPDLGSFESSSFDFVYSNVVLQHLPSSASACGYVAEFLRVVRPNGLVVFQMPYRLLWRRRLQPRRRAYRVLRRLGVSERTLYEKAGLNPMRTISVPEHAMRAHIERHGGAVVVTEPVAQTNPSVYYYARPSPA